MGARRDRLDRMSDRPAIFAHALARRDRAQRELVPGGNRLAQGHALHALPRGERAQRHRDIVAGIEPQRGGRVGRGKGGEGLSH